jgi:hypothetical protein
MSLSFKPTPDQDNAPGAGHNSQVTPTDWASLLDPEGINALLGIEHERLVQKRDNLLAKYEKWKDDTADGLASTEQVSATTDFGGQIKQVAKLAEDTRVIVKAPFFQADKAVQNFFMNIINPLTDAVKTMEGRIGDYNRAEAKRLKAIADEEARIARENAERIAAAAVTTGNNDLIEQAQVEDEVARKAESVAAKPIAAFSQTRGNFAQSSGSIRYKFEVADAALIPREYLMIDESKVNRAINGKDRVTSIPGLTIIEDFKTTIRA